jgi:competence protein ComEC
VGAAAVAEGSRQLTLIGYRLSAIGIGHRLSNIEHRPSAIGHRPSDIGQESRMVLRRIVLAVSLAAAAVALPAAQTSKGLTVYVIDTEGGKAALWITPSGQTVLIDSGNPGGRDTDRLMEAIKDAGVTKIDYLVSTHYHVDHIGGVQELAKRIPIGTFVDHGPTVEEREQVANFQASYKELYDKAKHIVVKPGDKLPLTGVDWTIVTAAGDVLKKPLAGGGKPNAECATFQPKDITTDPENGQSVGSVITFGQFRAADFADLLWNKEHDLMCPNNPIGTIDLFMVSHHGLDASNSPQLVHALAPRVAVMQNGTRKGAGAATMPTLRTSPGLEDIWQLHWGYGAGIEQNSAGVFIANVDDNQTIATALTAPPRGGGPGGGGPGGGGRGQGAGAPGGGGAGAAGAAGAGAGGAAGAAGAAAGGAAGAAGAPGGGAPGAPPAGGPPQGGGPGGGGGRGPGAATGHTPAYWIKVVAQQDGSFTVSNSRNGYSKTYPARPRGK